MALSNILILSQISGYVVSLILACCLLVSLSLHVKDFNGHCLLFATGSWQEDDGLYNVSWPSRGYCNYSITIAVFLVLASIIQIYRFTRIVYKGLESSFLGLCLDVIFGILFCVAVLIAAFIITLGFIVWCSGMTQRFPSCEIVAGQNITKTEDQIDTNNFYIEMGTAQFGAWASFANWVGLSVFALLKLINNHQLRNMKVSMYLERQRLVNEDSFKPIHDDSGVVTPELQEGGSSGVEQDGGVGPDL